MINSSGFSALPDCPASPAVKVGGLIEPRRPAGGGQSRHDRLHRNVSAFVLAFVAGLLLAAPRAIAHETKMDGNPSNDWIEQLKNNSGNLCCGNSDCRPVVAGGLRSSSGGGLQVEIEGDRYPVPEGTIVPDTSPDGRAWVCPDLRPVLGGFTYRIRGVRCLLLPPLS